MTLPTTPTPTATTWADSAAGLARRVNRRSVVESALRAAGPWLSVGGALAVAARAAGAETAVVATFAGAGLVVGTLRAVLAGRHAPRVAPGDAAWALDRLGRLGERGLAAATLAPGTVAEPPPVPPAPGLRPPGGLALALAGVLLGALAFVAPQAADDGDPGDATAPAGHGSGSGAGSDGAPAPRNGSSPAAPGPNGDATPDADATPAPPADPDTVPASPLDVARAALNLPPERPFDRADLMARLADPAARERLAAALAGHPVGTLLAEGDNAADSAAAALLAEQAHEAEALERARRRAAARALAVGTEPVPLARRPLVARYLERLER
ncbi:MAG: hypothetical protein AB7T63_17130 [Planctomycetota bacterium]